MPVSTVEEKHLSKKDEQIRLHTMKLQKHNRIKDEVFDNKKDAEDFLKKSKK